MYTVLEVQGRVYRTVSSVEERRKTGILRRGEESISAKSNLNPSASSSSGFFPVPTSTLSIPLSGQFRELVVRRCAKVSFVWEMRILRARCNQERWGVCTRDGAGGRFHTLARIDR